MTMMFDEGCAGNLQLTPPETFTPEELLRRDTKFDVFATPSIESQSVPQCPPGAYSSPADPESSGTGSMDASNCDVELNGAVEGEQGSGEATTSCWVLQPTAPSVREGESEIWHYTDAGGLIGAITSDCLWATALRNLNDEAEYHYGRSVLDDLVCEVRDSRYIHPLQKRYVERIVEMTDETVAREGLFVLCASTAAHSLAQWRAYGRGLGHALVLDGHRALSVLSPTPVANTISTIPHVWRRVLYAKSEQRSLLLKGLSYLAYKAPQSEVGGHEELMLSDASVLLNLLMYCKEPSFEEEQEVRMVVQAPAEEALCFRSSSTGVTPYLKLTGAETLVQRTSRHPKSLPVQGCVIGPFPARDSSAFATRKLLDQAGYGNATIEVSTSSLR